MISNTSKSHDYRASVSRPSLYPQLNRSSTQTLSHRDDIKSKGPEQHNKNKGPESSKVSSTIKCYKCQDYGHLAANCPNLIRITIIDERPPKPLSQTLMCASLREKILKLMKSPQVMMLVSIVLVKHHPLTCMLLNVSPPYQPKKTIGEKVLHSTRSPKLKIRVVK